MSKVAFALMRDMTLGYPNKTDEVYKTVHRMFSCSVQDEKALYDAARGGDVATVRRLVACNVNINCTPYPVGHD